MVYEEDVPVIVRRRGCMLRVRITSFADDSADSADESASGRQQSLPVGIAIELGLLVSSRYCHKTWITCKFYGIASSKYTS
jgi:hypothetical protein